MMTETHNKIKEHFNSLENIHSVSEVIELPNKYGDNVSHFSLKYNYEDQFNYTVQDFNINWDKKTVFIRCEGYFNFNTPENIIDLVSKHI